MDKHLLTRIFIAAATATFMLMAAGCGERKAEKKATAMGPEETAEAFFRAAAGGDFDKAMRLCDTTAMKGYIEDYAKALNMLEKKDSSALSIATEHLAEAVFAIEDVVRNGDKRMVMFTIDAGEGMNKKKTATLRKEEGEWKVEKITDSH